MTSDYLTASELAELVGCKTNQRACMVRWLEKGGWAFAIDRNGFPKVLRLYHDRRLGVAPNAEESAGEEFEPDFAALDEWVNSRKERSRSSRKRD
jgi:hypothetical protein